MTYPTLATVNATTDLSNIFLYVNSITDGIAMPAVLFAFFMIVLLGGFFAELKYGRPRFPASFTVAAFTSFGLAVIMSQKTGLLNPIYLVISLGLSILGVVWMLLSSE